MTVLRLALGEGELDSGYLNEGVVSNTPDAKSLKFKKSKKLS